MGPLPCLGLALVMLSACITTGGDQQASLTSDVAGTVPLSDDLDFAGSIWSVPDMRPGQRPSIESDEAGLWMAMDRIENNLKTAGSRVRDKALNDYVSGIVCRLAGPYCDDIRTYIVRRPYFNASMAPNGTMQVWTGFLLRARNEAQLATVLGHEIGHYLRRHSLQRLRDVRATSDILTFVQFASALAGVGAAGNLATLIAMGHIYGFSRDNEREADSVGLRLMAEGNYDPREAAKIWDHLIREKEASEKFGFSLPFFATHPPPDERSETLNRMAEEFLEVRSADELGKDRFHEVVLPRRAAFLRDELGLRSFKTTEELLTMLLEDKVNPGEILFFQGELYRLRDEDGDGEKALELYGESLQAAAAPVADVHRSIGLIHLKSDEKEKARAAFTRYLELRPDADDRLMIESMLGG